MPLFGVEYLVCPVCGNPMRLVNGKWVCPVCGYTVPLAARMHAVAVATKR